ncbi:hypothetical protein ASE40_18465 [Flavobacterium sp. Root935]|nr:hypothetical protein ASE40_18465 [Flavobacterium sp. Root935]
MLIIEATIIPPRKGVKCLNDDLFKTIIIAAANVKLNTAFRSIFIILFTVKTFKIKTTRIGIRDIKTEKIILSNVTVALLNK